MRRGTTFRSLLGKHAIYEVLNPPVALDATNIGVNSFTVNWNPVVNATGYYLDISTNIGFTTFLSGYQNLYIGSSLSRVISNTLSGKQYYYRIRATNGYQISVNSNIKSLVTLYGYILTPTGNGTGVSTLELWVSNNVTITLSGTAKFYSNIGGTLDESNTWTATPGVRRKIYLKCPSGNSNMLFSNITYIIEWGNEVGYYGWASGINGASISGSDFLLTNVQKVHILGNNTFSFNVNTLPSNCTYFSCDGSNTITGLISDVPANIQYLYLGGINTLSGDIINIPITLKELSCFGANTLTGNIVYLPSTLTRLYIAGNNTISGDLSDLKTGLITFYIYSSSITGSLSNIPSSLKDLEIHGTNHITGNITDLNSGMLTLVLLGGSHSIEGDLSDMPSGITKFLIDSSASNITGDLSDIPSTMQWFTIIGAGSITGNLSSIPSSVSYFLLSITNGSVTGDLNSLPAGMRIFSLGNVMGTISYTAGRTWSSAMSIFYIIPSTGGGLTTTEIDNLLIDLSNSAWNTYGYSSGNIILTGINDPRSSNSDTALATLLAKNVYVSTNGIVVPHTDYFLPANAGLNAMYVNLYLYSVGNFSNGYYWMSSEFGASDGGAANFSTGLFSGFAKSSTFRVRACRKFTAGNICSVRDVGPAGGLIFDKIDNGDGTYDYYEAAPNDQSVSCIWSNVNTEIGPTAQGMDIEDGIGNTNAIVSQIGHTTSAAKLCKDLSV